MTAVRLTGVISRYGRELDGARLTVTADPGAPDLRAILREHLETWLAGEGYAPGDWPGFVIRAYPGDPRTVPVAGTARAGA